MTNIYSTYSETPHDFQIKYGDTFSRVKLPEEFYTHPGRVYSEVGMLTGECFDDEGEAVPEDSTSFTFAGISLFFRMPNSTETNSMIFQIPLENIEFRSLALGAINLSRSSINLLSNVPDSPGKYRKLPHRLGVRVYDPFITERHYLNLPGASKTLQQYDLLQAWANNSYFSATDALQSVREGKRLSSAFNSEYSFGMYLKGGGIYLYYHGVPLFKVTEDGMIIIPREKRWMIDEVEYFGLSYLVEE